MVKYTFIINQVFIPIKHDEYKLKLQKPLFTFTLRETIYLIKYNNIIL